MQKKLTLPCNIGDKVWVTTGKKTRVGKIIQYHITDNSYGVGIEMEDGGGFQISLEPETKKKTVQRVAVTWEMCGYVDIEADTMEEAMEKVKEDMDHIKLPENGEYVGGSFSLSSEDVDEMVMLTMLEEKALKEIMRVR